MCYLKLNNKDHWHDELILQNIKDFVSYCFEFWIVCLALEYFFFSFNLRILSRCFEGIKKFLKRFDILLSKQFTFYVILLTHQYSLQKIVGVIRYHFFFSFKKNRVLLTHIIFKLPLILNVTNIKMDSWTYSILSVSFQ